MSPHFVRRPMFVLALNVLLFSSGDTLWRAPVAQGQIEDWRRMRPIVPRSYLCRATAEPPVLDGRLDDTVWEQAGWTEEFSDIEGDPARAPALRTRVKMLWDSRNLYIAAELTEPHVHAQLQEHDAVIFYDNDFEVFIDPDADHHNYAELEINALNTTWDLLLPRPYKDGGHADHRFELSGVQTAVHVMGTLNDPGDMDVGWCVEIAIPWHSLSQLARHSGPPNVGEQWRMNFSRVQWQHHVVNGRYQSVPGTREDNWVWSPQGIIDMHRPERWGYVRFSSDPDTDAAPPDSAERNARDRLMTIYHGQKSFRSQQQRWAADLDDLDLVALVTSELNELSTPIDSSLPADTISDLTLHLTQDGFQASVLIRTERDGVQRWCVDQTSRIFRSPYDEPLRSALERAGSNRPQLQKALHQSAGQQRVAMEFLIANMPERDLQSLSSDFLCENVRLAFAAWQSAPWKHQVPWEIFLNHVLPYASINEQRDAWRRDFVNRFAPLLEGATTPAQAAVLLNQKMFTQVNVKYSTQRPRADQSPLESIRAGLASCTGLSVLLIDACRSQGIPARFVGTPLWSDHSGNHSWVEIWDNGWHFTGAAEPVGNELNRAWFTDRASTAVPDDPQHAIYAVSFQKTPVHFPLVWDRTIRDVPAVDVTARYLAVRDLPPDGTVTVRFEARNRGDRKRIAAKLRIYDQAERLLFEGTTKDDRYDTNDLLHTHLTEDTEYRVEVATGKTRSSQMIHTRRDMPVVTFLLDSGDQEPAPLQAPQKNDPPASATHLSQTSAPLQQLQDYLARPVKQRGELRDQAFTKAALNADEAAVASNLLWQDHVHRIREERSAEVRDRQLTLGELKMPFYLKIFGEAPPEGHSLYLSLHGGGGAPPHVNQQQWENQKRLYQPAEGIYLAPRAPTDTWNLWHQDHIDRLFDRLIEDLIVLENVDPNRVYLLGYSAGGDGVYQLAPRMADRFAAAAMMAGHPNETSPLGLRNLPFTLHMGGLDTAYRRNETALEWSRRLDELQSLDPQGYDHWVSIYPDKAHWMDREDAAALPWMAARTRQPLPQKIVWKQDDVVRTQFYWLQADPADLDERAEVTAQRDGNHFTVQSTTARRLTLLLNDQMIDFSRPVHVTINGGTPQTFSVTRSIGQLADSLQRRGDPYLIFSGAVVIDVPPSQ